ncbi:SoxR reducing system RseC family protein [Psychromonas antarctica]|jgi:sigma-E factor negative regulatory protein RseC|uniref:SoxR reducing system RseC family protein n=1 Tax=Psychromonas antarctica TaxID=67573 RepID=UPI001EE80A13|nr:SoxR reducing system RseC family protein [Psychromonas antarctica]MCG6201492.1 SoxR reducing system RseC family protein [Psychromonas antarctica]
MIKETGKIITIEDQGTEKVAVVECISRSACSSCHNESSCGVGAVAKAFSDKSHQFKVPYKEGMEVNNFIELQINNSDLIKSATLAYLVPLLFFIGGALITKQFYSVNESMLILIAISFAAIGFVVTRILSSKLFPKKHINEIISSELKQ